MNDRVLILYSIGVLLLVGGGIALWSWLQLKAFIRSHTAISSQQELDDLKRVVKTDMFLAISILLVVGLVMLIGVVGVYRDLVDWSEFYGLFGLGSVCSVAGVILIRAEKQLRTIPLDDESLRDEYDHVLKTWTSSMLPDW